jgi:2-phospho-L-lactate/phosphoenolpyruvate guanylyltransferase
MALPGRPSFERTWALVPLRGLSSAKTRLGPDLDPAARRQLVEALLRRTLLAARDARSIAGTVVVTKDPEVAGMAQAAHAVGLVESVPGLNEAIDAARSVAIGRGATAVLVLPADLPAVSAEAIDAIVAAATAAATAEATAAGAGAAAAPGTATDAGLVALVTDRHGRGTNALLLSPPGVIDPSFGEASRGAHRAAAASAGAAWLEIPGPLSLDLDTPADLLVAAAALQPRPG